MPNQQIADKAAALMPDLIGHLESLVSIPSVAFPGYPAEPVMEMAERALALFRDVGFTNAQLMEVPTGYPPIYGEIPGPEGSPVVMLYGHYDVQPAPPEQGWTTDPWTPTRQADGRIYGRGAADDKGGLAIHLGTMQIFEGNPPCTIRLMVEGMEETASNLEPFVDAHPDLFDCDLFIVCDMGNLKVGEPVLTTRSARRRRVHRDRAYPPAPAPLGPFRWCGAGRHDGARADSGQPRRRRGHRGSRRGDDW